MKLLVGLAMVLSCLAACTEAEPLFVARDGGRPVDAAATSSPLRCDEQAEPPPAPDIGAAWVVGGSGDEVVRGLSLHDDGDVFAGGVFDGTLELDGTTHTAAGEGDGFVARFDRDGAVSWITVLEGAMDVELRDVASDGDNVYAVGVFAGDLTVGGETFSSAGGQDGFVLSLDPAGALRWFVRFGGDEDEELRHLDRGPSGELHATGVFRRSATIGRETLTASGKQGVVVTLGDDGTYRSSQRLGTWVDGVVAAPSGDVYVAGTFNHGIRFAGSSYEPVGDGDIALASLGRNTSPAWLRAFGGPESEFFGGLAAQESGGVVVSGCTKIGIDLGTGHLPVDGSRDAFAGAYEPSGAARWSFLFGANGNDHADAVQLAGGRLYVAGTIKVAACVLGAAVETSAFHNPFVFALPLSDDSEGAGWALSLGSDEHDEVDALVVGPAGAAFVAGHGPGTVEIDGEPLRTGDGDETFLLRLDPP